MIAMYSRGQLLLVGSDLLLFKATDYLIWQILFTNSIHSLLQILKNSYCEVSLHGEIYNITS